MLIKKCLIFLVVLLLFCLSCKKVETVEANLVGTWNRILYDHYGSEKWIFTADNKIYIVLTYQKYNINEDTVCVGEFVTDIVRYSHGNFYNKNFRKVPQITISGFENFKFDNNQQNIWYPAYNTAWEVEKLDGTSLLLTTQNYDNKPGGLEIREFYKE